MPTMLEEPGSARHRRQHPRRGHAAGFTLVESLVALLLATLLLLTALAVQGTGMRATRRRAAHAAAERALADAYEGLRAGVAPLATGPLAVPTASGFDGALGLEVTAEGTPGLVRLHLVAVYDAAGRPSRRHLEALLFSP